jgi:hypothetical protein
MKKLFVLASFLLVSLSALAQTTSYTDYEGKLLLAYYGGSEDTYTTHAQNLCVALGHKNYESYKINRYGFALIDAYTATGKENDGTLSLIRVSDHYATFNPLVCID